MCKQKVQYTESSGNVYQDLGFADAPQRLAKAQLALFINELIKKRGLTQLEAAEILGINQPKVSALVNGRLAGFSLERLFNFLNLLNHEIEIHVHPQLNLEHQQRSVEVILH